MSNLADAYSNLADWFEECESTMSYATVLREEVERMRWLADEAS